LTSVQAQIGLASLPRLATNNLRRHENARHLITALAQLNFVKIPSSPSSALPIYLRLPVIVASSSLREMLWQRLQAAGIGAGRMYEHALPTFFPEFSSGAFPGAEQVAGCLLTLPTHHYLTSADVQKMVGLFRLK
jgi:dTDP-4-amino-4,6-dideoxygalactose transaminase